MTWKTDWTAIDDHAREGEADIVRLISNYNELKVMLNAEYGFNVAFNAPVTSGYRTMPFDDFLNAIEVALSELHVWSIQWVNKTVTWQPAQPGPTHEDINRWEKNGQQMELSMQSAKAIFLRAGADIAGLPLYFAN